MFTHDHRLASAILAFALLVPATLHAQQSARPSLLEETAGAAPAPATVATTGTTAPPARSAADEEVVELSVFSVNATRDEGYQSLNTASGSRINTALKDTPAAISPFSAEFLADIGATTVEDMLDFGLNVEADTDDAADVSGDNDAGRNAGSQDTRFRIRGMAMDISLDNVATGNPMDTYNVDRAEVSSGPNSILFGMGNAGGLLTLTSKRANLQRNSVKIQNVVGTWINPGKPWNYYRATLDYNIALMPKKMALRVNSLYQEGGNNSWRKWLGRHDKRINPVLTVKPFKTTTINFNYEVGSLKESITNAWNASDGLTAWLTAGRPILSSFNPPESERPLPITVESDSFYYTVSPIAQRNSTGGSPRFTFFDNNNTLYDMRQSYYSNNIYPGSGNNYRLPESMSSYYYSTLGPGGMRSQKFDRYQFVLEQRIGKFNFQLSYDYNKNDSESHYPQGQDSLLQGDPNFLISTYVWTAVGSPVTTTGLVPDPYSGRLYMEDRWMKRVLNVRNETYRMTGEYSLNLKKWGRHRFIVNLEHATTDRYNNALSETLVDENQMAISAPNTPANNENYVFRRHYVTEGDFSTYYSSDWGIPLPEIYMNGHMYRSTYVGARTSINRIRKTTDTVGLTLQSYLLGDRMVLTAGARLDDITFKRATKAPINDPNDPRILNKTKVWREWDFDGGWEKPIAYNPYTVTAGGVWHATNRLSVFGNFSTNRGAPYLDGRTVLPGGDDPPPSEGRTFDYGVMYDVLANNKIFIRLTKFDTKMVKDASSGGGDYADSGALGSTNMYNIYDALYFLNVTNQTGTPDTTSFTTPTGGTITPGPGQGPMPAEMYAVRPATPTLPYGAPPSYNAGMFNTHSGGYEAELTANFTKNFTMRVAFSWTQRERLNIYDEIFEYYEKNIPVWLDLANQHNPNSPDGAYWVSVGNYRYTLHDYVMQQLYVLGGNAAIAGGNNGNNGTSVRQGLANRMLNVSGAMGARPIKLNITSRYSFRKGWLKGLAIGGSVRYQSRNQMPSPDRVMSALAYLPADGSEGLALDRSIFVGDTGMVQGNSLVFWDGFLTYKCKLFGGRTNATFQLNVKNIFTQSLVTVSRVSQYDAVTRVYINTPRTIRFTATFEF